MWVCLSMVIPKNVIFNWDTMEAPASLRAPSDATLWAPLKNRTLLTLWTPTLGTQCCITLGGMLTLTGTTHPRTTGWGWGGMLTTTGTTHPRAAGWGWGGVGWDVNVHWNYTSKTTFSRTTILSVNIIHTL